VDIAEDVLAGADAGGRIARGSAIRLVGYGLGVALSLVSVPLLTRHLGVAGFGSFVTVLSLSSIVALVADAGLTVIGVREYVTLGPSDRSRLVANILALRLVIATAGVLVVIGFGYAAGYEPSLVSGIALAGVGVLLLTVYQTYTIPLAADLRLVRVTALELLRQALMVAGYLLLIVAGAGIVGFLAIPIPVGVVLVIVTALAIRHLVSLRPGLDRIEARSLLAATLPVAAASILGALFYKIAVVMMSVISNDDQTGYFSASVRIIEVIVPVASLITSAAFPLLVRSASDAPDRFVRRMQRLFEIVFVLGAAITVLLVVGARPLILFVGGEEFLPAVPVLQIQGASVWASFLFAAWAAGLLASNAQRSLATATVVGVAAVVALTAALAPTHGAEGTALAMTLSEGTLAAVTGVLLMRRRPDLRFNIAILPKVAVAVACGLVVSLLELPQVVLAALAVAVYCTVLGVLGGVPPELRHVSLQRWNELRRGQ
jgi:O-antigen/teichoic acid export membrane protein